MLKSLLKSSNLPGMRAKLMPDRVFRFLRRKFMFLGERNPSYASQHHCGSTPSDLFLPMLNLESKIKKSGP